MGGRAHSGAHFIGRARRWIRRRSQRVRNALSQDTARPRSNSHSHSHSNSNSNSNSYSISNSSKQSVFSQKREKEKEIVEVGIEEERQQEEEEEEIEEFVETEELGILGLKLIEVPLRWNMAGFDAFKKVLHLFSFIFSYYMEGGILILS